MIMHSADEIATLDRRVRGALTKLGLVDRTDPPRGSSPTGSSARSKASAIR
jgi:hypothetical protein